MRYISLGHVWFPKIMKKKIVNENSLLMFYFIMENMKKKNQI